MPEASKLAERLSLYQVFLKLYEHNRELLYEILQLEDSDMTGLAPPAMKYAIGAIGTPQPYLIANLLNQRSQLLQQPESIWTIGRSSKAAIPIADERLSRRHAAIRYQRETDAFYLYDLGSTNGSFINSELIQHSQRLVDGDRIRLGSLVFTFFECRQQIDLPHATPQLIQQLDRDRLPQSAPNKAARSTNPFLAQLPEIEEMTTQPLPKLTRAQQERILDRFFRREAETE